MKTSLKYIFTAALILVGAVLFVPASAIPARPEPARLVNDFAGLFSSSQRTELERMLVNFDDTTSNQITVVTVTDLEGYQASQYATDIGIEWKVGSKKFDNGIVLLVKPKTANEYGDVFIAVGYGLEGAIPDAYAKRIVSDYLIPKFKENDYYGGVYDACTVLMKLASGEFKEFREKSGKDSPVTDFIIFGLFIAIIVVSVLMSGGNSGKGGNSGNRRRSDDTFIFFGPSSGHYRGGGFGGGSFSGGGFGGFGGGSFGGGGSGGKW